MKTLLANGVAHLSFPGGGIFLPARNPYDRQLLAEHLAHRVRASRKAQVLVNDQRWMVYANLDRDAVRCSVCGSLSDVACYTPSTDGVSFCVTCAFSEHSERQVRSRPRKMAPRTRQVALDAATLQAGPRPARRFIEKAGRATGSANPTNTPYIPLAESDDHFRRAAVSR